MLIVMHGLPGAGKTSIAMELAPKLRSAYVSVDFFWRRLGHDPLTSAEAERRAVYGAAVLEAGVLLESGTDVVIDCTSRSAEFRVLLTELAEACGQPILYVVCSAKPRVLEQRLRERLGTGHLGAGAEHLRAIAMTFQRISKGQAAAVFLETSNLEPRLQKVWRRPGLDTEIQRVVDICLGLTMRPHHVVAVPLVAIRSFLNAWWYRFLLHSHSNSLVRIRALVNEYEGCPRVSPPKRHNASEGPVR